MFVIKIKVGRGGEGGGSQTAGSQASVDGGGGSSCRLYSEPLLTRPE